MVEENLSQKFRLKNIDETSNYFIEETNQNELISKKCINVFMCYWICFSFCFFSWYFCRHCEFCSRIKICAITSGIKTYKAISKKKKQKHDEILFAKTKLNTVDILISMAISDSYISHEQFLLASNVLRKYGAMKEAIKN